ncbi:m-AAA protease-interacting protein 1, mitochondrial [Conger conger]|uniref:m-AAA protease-interacting protein 1, mitochondrial n=1 Tax=Conger conger TaxID=82655 RepID=UPI002A5ABB00|nr:m-AAA protease-interacting protein 1, mitochondrial [Conger conger]
MQFLIAVCRELGGRAARISLACPWKLNSRQWACHHTCCSCPYTEERTACKHNMPHLRRHIVFLAGGQKSRHYCTRSDKGPTSGSHPGISVVGTPNPISLIRNKIILFLIQLYLDISPVEFEKGAKQALVCVSNLLSHGKFEELRDVMSNEVVEHARKKYKTLTETERQNLAIASDDIIFLIPEDVSLFYDTGGRRFCYVVMRFWHLSGAEVPEDPEGSRIFKLSEAEGDGPPKRILTAVYEFHRELTHGAPPDWTVTGIWHWKQLE